MKARAERRANSGARPATPRGWVAAALGGLVGVLATPAAAADLRYQVKAGDSCLSVARRHYPDAKAGLARMHAANQLGPLPHALVPGSTLLLPDLGTPEAPPPPKPPVETAPEARLSRLRNQVETFTPEQHPGRIDEPLAQGNKVATLASSNAEVTFVDATRLDLGEHTLVVILGRGSAAPANAPRTELQSGELRARLDALAGRPFTVRTPAAEATLTRGTGLFGSDAERLTRVAIHEGQGSVVAAKKKVAVPEGFGTRATPGKAPSPPRPLPLPPEWVGHAAPAWVLGEATATLTAPYQPRIEAGFPAVVRWHVQLARDEAFGDRVLDARVDQAITSLEARELTPGPWWARVAAIDADGMEGRFSSPQRLAVTGIRLTEPQPGRAATAVAVGASSTCSVRGLDGAEHDLNRPVALPALVPLQVECVDAASGATHRLPLEPSLRGAGQFTSQVALVLGRYEVEVALALESGQVELPELLVATRPDGTSVRLLSERPGRWSGRITGAPEELLRFEGLGGLVAEVRLPAALAP